MADTWSVSNRVELMGVARAMHAHFKALVPDGRQWAAVTDPGTALEALAHECAIKLDPGQARRNLVTRGVPLNHLVGKEFQVGGVVLRGLRLCEPCGHLEGLTIKGVKDGLCHRGGLRAQIVRGGVVKTGDAIAATEKEQSEKDVQDAEPFVIDGGYPFVKLLHERARRSLGFGPCDGLSRH